MNFSLPSTDIIVGYLFSLIVSIRIIITVLLLLAIAYAAIYVAIWIFNYLRLHISGYTGGNK